MVLYAAPALALGSYAGLGAYRAYPGFGYAGLGYGGLYGRLSAYPLARIW